MSEMIERVAKAIMECPTQQKFYADMPPNELMVLMEARGNELARAAIEAMRNPTDAMVKSGSEIILREGTEDSENVSARYFVTHADNSYVAMIDEALR